MPTGMTLKWKSTAVICSPLGSANIAGLSLVPAVTLGWSAGMSA